MKPTITRTAPPIVTASPNSLERWVLCTLALSMLQSSLGISIANVALPALAKAFSASFHAVQWIMLAYLLAITVTIVGAGRLGDLLGHRRVLIVGIGLFTIASMLCGMAPNLWLLIAARAAQGVGAAILMALTVALVRETVPKERTGSAMGLIGTMSAIGTALGPALGGVLLAEMSWRAIFFVMVPLGGANVVLAQRYLPTNHAHSHQSAGGFDVVGTLLLGFSLAAYALAMTAGRGHLDRLNLALLGASVVGVCLFVWVEAKVTSPLINLSLFRHLNLSASLVMNALVSTVMMATLVVGPFYLSRALGLRDTLVGVVMSVGPALSIISGIVAGRIVDRLGAPNVVMAGLVQMATGCFALSVIPTQWGVVGYIAGIAVLTPGYQLFQAANSTAVMVDVPSDLRGLISGMLSLSRNLGLITGASVMGAVFAYVAAATDITTALPNAVAHGMQITFAVAVMMLVLATFIAIGSRRYTQSSPTAAYEDAR